MEKKGKVLRLMISLKGSKELLEAQEELKGIKRKRWILWFFFILIAQDEKLRHV